MNTDIFWKLIEDAQRKTGQPIPEYGYTEFPVLIGENSWSVEEIPAKFPRIMEKLGKYSDEDVDAAWF